MSTILFIYLERLVDGIWIFEGERRENVDYDPEHSPDQPEYGPIPLLLGRDPLLYYHLSFPVDTILEDPLLSFGRRGLPHDISAELGRWAKADKMNRFYGWVTVRELDAFDWNAVTTVRMVVKRNEVKSYPGCVENSVVSGLAIDWSNVRHLGPITPRDFPSLAPEIYADITWQPSYARLAGFRFMEEVVRTLGRRYGPSDMARIIYWFN